MLEQKNSLSPTDYLFSEARETFEHDFKLLVSEAGFSAVPHQLRHGGASDMALRDKGLQAIQKRGRWLCLASVQRYAKPWTVLVGWALIPSELCAEAEQAIVAGDVATWRDAQPVTNRSLRF